MRQATDRIRRPRPSTRRAFLAGASASLLAGCAAPGTRIPIGDAAPTAPSGSGRLGFVGDVMLGRNVDDHHADTGPAAIWDDVLPRLEALDGLFANLECCLSTRGERYPDRAYYFRADPSWAVPALERAGTTWTALANNHLLDYGPEALLDTVDALGDGGIANAGAGATPDEAYAPSVVSVGDLTVGCLSITDNAPEYAVSERRPGTAYVACDPDDYRTRRRVADALETIREADPDVVVASIHWGPNWVAYPARRYREFARWLADHGVTIVHGHSAHVFQGIEVHEGSLIVHDAGDFVDDYVVKPDLRNDRSFLFEVEISEGRLDELRLVPVEIDDLAVHRASDEAAAWARETMRERSGPFDTEFERAGDGLRVDLR